MKWYELEEMREFARFCGDADPFTDSLSWWECALAWFVELLAGK